MSPFRKPIKWLTGHPWLMALIIVLVVGSGPIVGFTLYNNEKERRDIQQQELVKCITQWADEVSGRSSALKIANDELRTAEDNLIRSVATGDRSIFQKNYDTYITKSDNLIKVSKEHPVPDAPNLRCDDGVY